MSHDILKKLVDLYAAHELPLAVEEEMEAAATADPELAFEMRSLRETVDSIRESEKPVFSAEIEERILSKILMRQYGQQLSPIADEDASTNFHYQYQLPIRS